MADLLDHGCVEEITPSLWPEDTVEYRIHCLPAFLTAGGGDISARDAISRLAVECNYMCKCLSGNHVWHYAALSLGPEISGV